jgi:hypothetical protein
MELEGWKNVTHTFINDDAIISVDEVSDEKLFITCVLEIKGIMFEYINNLGLHKLLKAPALFTLDWIADYPIF